MALAVIVTVRFLSQPCLLKMFRSQTPGPAPAGHRSAGKRLAVAASGPGAFRPLRKRRER